MLDIRPRGSTSNLVRFTLKDKTTGQGKTGLSTATSGLVISTLADNEATAVSYSGSNLETIAVLGTYAAPSANKCRFGEVDSTNHKGLYEFQFADARFAVANSKRLIISVNDGESTILDADYEIELTVELQIATALWQDLLSGSDFSTTGSIGKLLKDNVTSVTIADIVNAVLDEPTASHIAAGTVGLAIASPPDTSTIAESILKYDWTAITGEAAHSMINALRFLRNKWSLDNTGVLTVYAEDGTTIAWSKSVVTSVAAAPVTGVGN